MTHYGVRKSLQGFTIVELLIVIVVIAILAVISIVAYNGIQARATNTTVESDLSNLSKKLELYKIDEGNYPVSTAELETADFTLSTSAYLEEPFRNNFFYCVDANSPDEYAIGAITSLNQGYYLTNGVISQTSATIYANQTCDQIGLDHLNAPPVTFHSGWNGSSWQNWT